MGRYLMAKGRPLKRKPWPSAQFDRVLDRVKSLTFHGTQTVLEDVAVTFDPLQ